MITVIAVDRPNKSATFDVSGTCVKFVLVKDRLIEVSRYKNSQIYDWDGMNITKNEYADLARRAGAILKGVQPR